jgi:diamine N-acetyltransferase
MDKIFIRPLRIEDSDVSYKWRNNPEIWKYTGSRSNQLITIEIERDWLSRVLQKTNQRRFAICVNEESHYVGNVQLTDIEEDKAQFHIFIGDRKYWGRGIASKATRLLLIYGFETLRLHEIYLYVHKDNIAAIKLYQKCGFNYQSEYGDQIFMIARNT